MMHKPITYHEASRILSDVHEQHSFKARNGVLIKNLYELQEQLRRMDEAEFAHHANSDKNDFVAWIRGVVNDYDLAQELAKCRTRQQFLHKLGQRIEHLHLVKHGAVFPHKVYMDYALYDFLGGIIVGLLVGLVMVTLV